MNPEKHYAFVSYVAKEDAETAKRLGDGVNIDGRALRVNWGKQHQQQFQQDGQETQEPQQQPQQETTQEQTQEPTQDQEQEQEEQEQEEQEQADYTAQ